MANTYTLISSNTVGAGGASSITFSSIPAIYTDLVLKVCLRQGSGSGNAYGLRFNSDTASNYTAKVLRNNGNVAGSYTYSNVTMFEIKVPGSADQVSTFSNDEFYIPGYLLSNAKYTSLDNSYDINTSSYDSPLSLQTGRWSGTAAISSITIVGTSAWNFAQYSAAYLYGIKNS